MELTSIAHLLPDAPRSLGRIDRPVARDERADASTAATRFEEVFLRMLLSEMLPEEGGEFFGKESGARIFRGLFVGAVAETLASAGTLGIRDVIERQLEGEPPAGVGSEKEREKPQLTETI